MVRWGDVGKPVIQEPTFRTYSHARRIPASIPSRSCSSARRDRAPPRAASVGSVIAMRAAVRPAGDDALRRSRHEDRSSSSRRAPRAAVRERVHPAAGSVVSFLAPSAIAVYRCCRLIQIGGGPIIARHLRTVGVVQDREGPERATPKYPRLDVPAPHETTHVDRSGLLGWPGYSRTLPAFLPPAPFSVCGRILELELREVERGRFSVSRSSPCEPPVETWLIRNVLEIDGEVFERVLAGPLRTMSLPFLRCLAVAAEQHQGRRWHCRCSGVKLRSWIETLPAACAAAHVGRSRLGHSPGPGQKHRSLSVYLSSFGPLP